VTLLTTLLLVPLMLVTVWFAVEVVAGLWPLGRHGFAADCGVSVTILVPAHNEARIIGNTLRQLAAAVSERDRILVIADNCSDSTAQVARDCGVDVIERRDETRRGKGFALDHARSHIRASPPDVVMVIDSDCRMNRDSILTLAEACHRTNRPCQATYLLEPSLAASPLVQISTFAFCLKNLVRQRGLQRLAGGAHLTGTGMAFPWQLFAGADLANGSIVEDLRLGIDLARANFPPQMIEGAQVWSPAASEAATVEQRRRWEGGFLAMAMATAPGALSRALVRQDWQALARALDLLVPPVALLIIVNLAVLMVLATLAGFSLIGWTPISLQSIAFVAAATAIAVAWAVEGRRFIGLRSILFSPIYLLRKLLFYVKLAQDGPPKDWVRTERSD